MDIERAVRLQIALVEAPIGESGIVRCQCVSHHGWERVR